MQNKQKLYDNAADALRLIAILAVVLIHTTTRTLEASAFDLQRVPFTLFLNQVSRFAVPLFFMISGFVLELNYAFHASYFSYLKKRFSRLFVPYIFWSAVYYFFVYTKHGTSFLKTLLDGSSSYQLYFIPSLLIFYIVFPFIHKLYKLLASKWVLIALGILEVLLLYKDYFTHSISLFYPLRIALLNYYVFLLGTVASHHRETLLKFLGKWKIVLIFTTIILGSYVFLEGRNLYFKTHDYLAFYSQWRPSVFFYTIVLAGILYYFFSKKINFSLALKPLARLAFFVFFTHVIAIEVIWNKIGIHIFQQTSSHIAEQFWYDPLFFLSVALISFFAAYVVHKIPLLAKLTG